MTPQIPRIYRVFFTTLDPLLAATGVLTALFYPSALLKPYSPIAALPPALETSSLLIMLAGFYAATLLLQVVVLRMRPDDLGLWRVLQLSILFQDVFILAAFARSMGIQGRLSPLAWHADEAGTIATTAGVGFVRARFLLDRKWDCQKDEILIGG
ncbi:hypothetical protein BAUCODRAFT_146232 [Baudoinia panamericana UAMH 10762]|uniref:DUF7704 domain-containing protein n=1 Tax=Baudoinia panamericana (strain UAMH 10762) TaxID=717646 RepID=M2N5F9_BAUPA|nr:uncharacterized protein BAUCODRAFT_146232 [Baudoinia panamericana UAMH 10762]EMC99268.1 hypothetical protein BAUCODRAFT_146232 [Baudoinia panamericana UAMH 10762]